MTNQVTYKMGSKDEKGYIFMMPTTFDKKIDAECSAIMWAHKTGVTFEVWQFVDGIEYGFVSEHKPQ